MGSTTDFSMREAKCTNVITKPGSAVPVTDTPDTYVVYIDGNDSATQVATDVLTMMRPEDKVVFMHMVQRGQDEKSKPEGLLDSWWPGTIKEKFTKMLQQAGRQGEVKLVELENKHVYTLAIPNELNKMAEAVGASFIAIAADLVGAFHFDEGMQLIPQTDTKKSVSDRVVRTAKSTVIVSYSSQTAAQQIEEKAQGVASQNLEFAAGGARAWKHRQADGFGAEAKVDVSEDGRAASRKVGPRQDWLVDNVGDYHHVLGTCIMYTYPHIIIYK